MASPDDDLDKYLRALGELPQLSDDELGRLFEKAKSGDREARSQIIRAHLRLVVAMAKKASETGTTWPHEPLLNLISEGNLGLMEAVETYEQDASRPFHAHVLKCICRRMQDRLRLPPSTAAWLPPKGTWPPPHPPFPPVWDR